MSQSQPTWPAALNEYMAELDALDLQGLKDELREAEKLCRRADAVQAVSVSSLAARLGTGKIEQVLALSRREAADLVESCDALVSRPLVWEGLHEGRIDGDCAAEIVRILAQVPDPLREQLEVRAVAFGASHALEDLHPELLRMARENDPGRGAG